MTWLVASDFEGYLDGGLRGVGWIIGNIRIVVTYVVRVWLLYNISICLK